MKEKEHLCSLSSQKVQTMEAAEKDDLQQATASRTVSPTETASGADDFRALIHRLAFPHRVLVPWQLGSASFLSTYQLSTWNERL